MCEDRYRLWFISGCVLMTVTRFNTMQETLFYAIIPLEQMRFS